MSKRLSDEDVERIADAVARRMQRHITIDPRRGHGLAIGDEDRRRAMESWVAEGNPRTCGDAACLCALSEEKIAQRVRASLEALRGER